MTNKYKLRIYKLSGPNKGDLDHEEFFSARESMNNRYTELSKHIKKYALRPTAWEYIEEDWERLAGY